MTASRRESGVLWRRIHQALRAMDPTVSYLRRFQATKATLIRFEELFGSFSALAFLLSALAFLLSALAFLLSALAFLLGDLLWCRDDCASRGEPA